MEANRTKIISAFRSGESCRKIAKNLNLGCSPDTVRAYLKKWGVNTSKQYQPEYWGVSSDRNAQILKLRLEGKTQREIAEIFGISKERVKQILAKGLEAE
jgi:DNA-binding CsgD family transcriptional regulator